MYEVYVGDSIVFSSVEQPIVRKQKDPPLTTPPGYSMLEDVRRCQELERQRYHGSGGWGRPKLRQRYK